MSCYPIPSLCPPRTALSVLPDGGYYRDRSVPSQTHLQTGTQTHLHRSCCCFKALSRLHILLYILWVFCKVILNWVTQPDISDWQTDLGFYSLLFTNSTGLAPVATQNWPTVCVCRQWIGRSKQHKYKCLTCLRSPVTPV